MQKTYCLTNDTDISPFAPLVIQVLVDLCSHCILSSGPRLLQIQRAAAKVKGDLENQRRKADEYSQVVTCCNYQIK